jgi:hypothetical protein
MTVDLELILDKIDDACVRHGWSEELTHELLQEVHRAAQGKGRLTPRDWLAFARGFFGDETLN